MVPSARVERAVSSSSARCRNHFGLDGLAESARFELARVSPRRRLSGPQPYQISQLSTCLRRAPAAGSTVGLPGHRGQPRYRTERALFAGQRCTPVRRPKASEGARTLSSGLRIRCATCRAALAWSRYPRRDSNAHHRPPHDRASPLGLRGHLLGAEDSNLHELLQRQPCCRVTSAPKGPAGNPARRPVSAG
jgi:hypothetical protein